MTDTKEKLIGNVEFAEDQKENYNSTLEAM